MYFFRHLLAVTIFLCSFATFAHANDEPLLVIRFNQAHVKYEQPLYRVVKKAIDIKPATFFDVVSVIPETTNKKQNKMIEQYSRHNTDQVMNSLIGMGVPQHQTRLTYQRSPYARSNEIHLFVR